MLMKCLASMLFYHQGELPRHQNGVAFRCARESGGESRQVKDRKATAWGITNFRDFWRVTTVIDHNSLSKSKMIDSLTLWRCQRVKPASEKSKMMTVIKSSLPVDIHSMEMARNRCHGNLVRPRNMMRMKRKPKPSAEGGHVLSYTFAVVDSSKKPRQYRRNRNGHSWNRCGVKRKIGKTSAKFTTVTSKLAENDGSDATVESKSAWGCGGQRCNVENRSIQSLELKSRASWDCKQLQTKAFKTTELNFQ